MRTFVNLCEFILDANFLFPQRSADQSSADTFMMSFCSQVQLNKPQRSKTTLPSESQTRRKWGHYPMIAIFYIQSMVYISESKPPLVAVEGTAGRAVGMCNIFFFLL